MKPSRTERRFHATALAAALLAIPVSVGAQATTDAADASSATEAATFLLVPLGAHNVGLGGAVAGAEADVEGAVWNPAALAGIGEWAVYYHGANDFGTTTHAVGGVHRWGRTRVGLSLLAVDLGTIEGRDASNQPIGTIEPANTLAIVTIARPIYSFLEAGVSYKFVRLGGSCGGCSGLEPDATAHAFDVAVAGRLPDVDRLRIGLVLSNLGPGVAFRAGGPKDPLPTRIRLGGALEVVRPGLDRPLEVRARADLRQTFSEFDDLDLFAGAEIGYQSIAYLRAGYAASGAGRSGAALGVGVRYRGFGLDVGRSFDDFSGFDSDAPFQVSVSYQPRP
jgi:hypothetical protein